MKKKDSSRVYKTTHRFVLSKNHLITGGAIVGIILLFIVFTSSVPSQAETSTTTSTSRTAPPISHSTTSEAATDTTHEPIPLCTRATPKFGGSFSCDFTTDTTTVHYEYMESFEQILALPESYELKNDPISSPYFLRTGTIEGKFRLLGIDTTSQTVIDITSDESEETLKQWWENYTAAGAPQVISR